MVFPQWIFPQCTVARGRWYRSTSVDRPRPVPRRKLAMVVARNRGGPPHWPKLRINRRSGRPSGTASAWARFTGTKTRQKRKISAVPTMAATTAPRLCVQSAIPRPWYRSRPSGSGRPLPPPGRGLALYLDRIWRGSRSCPSCTLPRAARHAEHPCHEVRMGEHDPRQRSLDDMATQAQVTYANWHEAHPCLAG